MQQKKKGKIVDRSKSKGKWRNINVAINIKVKEDEERISNEKIRNMSKRRKAK